MYANGVHTMDTNRCFKMTLFHIFKHFNEVAALFGVIAFLVLVVNL